MAGETAEIAQLVGECVSPKGIHQEQFIASLQALFTKEEGEVALMVEALLKNAIFKLGFALLSTPQQVSLLLAMAALNPAVEAALQVQFSQTPSRFPSGLLKALANTALMPMQENVLPDASKMYAARLPARKPLGNAANRMTTDALLQQSAAHFERLAGGKCVIR